MELTCQGFEILCVSLHIVVMPTTAWWLKPFRDNDHEVVRLHQLVNAQDKEKGGLGSRDKLGIPTALLRSRHELTHPRHHSTALRISKVVGSDLFLNLPLESTGKFSHVCKMGLMSEIDKCIHSS